MAAGIYNFTIEQGTTFKRTFNYKDSSGNPLSLTGYSARMEIKDKIGGNQISFFSTTGVGLSIAPTNATNSVILTIDAGTTSQYTFTNAVYDLEIELAGVVTRLLQGKIKLSKEVTTSS